MYVKLAFKNRVLYVSPAVIIEMNNRERSFTGRETIFGKTDKRLLRSFLETV